MSDVAPAPAAKPKPVVKAVKPVAAAAPKPAAKPVAKAAKPVAKPAKAAKAAKPAAKPAKATKASKAAVSEKAARGEGAKYIAPEEKEAIQKGIRQKVRKPMTTGEVGEALGVPAWKVRRSCRALVAAGTHTMEREGAGGMLTITPVRGK